MNRSELTKAVHAAGLGKYAGRIAEVAADCIRVIPHSTSHMTVGASRLGGLPDLEEGLDWPRWQGQSLSFIAQISLADVAAFPVARALPRTGLLSFFYDADQRTWGFDPADAGSFRVMYSSGLRLQQRPIPEDVPEHGRYPVCSIELEADVSLPPHDWPEFSVLFDLMTMEEREAYIELDWQQHSQLFGYPIQIQGDMRPECAMVTAGIYVGGIEPWGDPATEPLRAQAPNWQLLLQIDSEDVADMSWGDAGLLYYWIPQQALVAHDFERVWMILQCS